MEKTIIDVPAGIRYISEWEGFSLPDFPNIMDKQITGCGFTEWVITNPFNMLLASPRLVLLENKEEQHPGEVFYARNDLDSVLNVDRDLSKSLSTIKKSEEEQEKLKSDVDIENNKKVLRNNIRNYVIRCMDENRPCKILVTYDSYRIVYETLQDMHCFDGFYTVVDEFQSIFTDSRFKSSTEIEFVSLLKSIKKLCFVSATPMMDEYLEMLPEFKNLPFIELNWGSLQPDRIIRPQLSIHPCQRITDMAVSIIKTYQIGNFEKTVVEGEDGSMIEVESKELVIYVNSVKNICDIIKKAGLTYLDTNILCSNTPDNQKKIRKAFGLKKGQPGGIGRVPLKHEPRKMFTLCTRTVYLGADFYSDCARSVILSDANIECLAVDITLDLPQILGRQRLKENPWKTRADLYVKFLNDPNKRTLEDFKKFINLKVQKTESLLRVYNGAGDIDKHTLAEKYQSKLENYRNDYVAVNTHGGSDLLPVFNNLVMVSEIRAFEIQQIDYPNRFKIMNQICSSGKYEIDPVMSEVDNFIIRFNSMPYFTDKMKLLCESNLSDRVLFLVLKQIPLDYTTYYNTLGPNRIKSCCYKKGELEKEYCRKKESSVGSIKEKLIYDNFSIGDRISVKSIKEKLKELYTSHGIVSTPKAVDLLDYFELKRTSIKDVESGKYIEAYEILSKKDR